MRAFVASNDRTRLDAASRASACDHAVEGAASFSLLCRARRGRAANEGSGGEGWSYRCIMIRTRAVISARLCTRSGARVDDG